VRKGVRPEAIQAVGDLLLDENSIAAIRRGDCKDGNAGNPNVEEHGAGDVVELACVLWQAQVECAYVVRECESE
jgi:hypothetical protein